MAKQITWSPLAIRKRSEILQFWINHNKSDTYSKKLNTSFRLATTLLSEYPEIGKPTTNENVRFKIVRHYLLFYEIRESNIYILTIWDSRQNPDSLRLR